MSVDILGYAGMILIILSILIKDYKMFRYLNFSGALISAIYAGVKGDMIPVLMMNAIITIIDSYYIYLIFKKSKSNEVSVSSI